MENTVINKINQRTWNNKAIVNEYGNLRREFKSEQVILEKIKPIIKDKKILDIGIGAGRTTKILLEISKDYTGIDYSSKFIDNVKKEFAGVNIILTDARDMSIFEDKTFDFAMFSLNGIDYVSNDDRRKILSETHRVLKEGGLFTFSTHNRNYKYFNKMPWQEKFSFNTIYLKTCIKSLLFLFRHISLKKHEIFTNEYAIINDAGHNFSLMTYYISIPDQLKQLKQSGFTDIKIYNMDGNVVNHDMTSPWLFYLVEK